MDDLDLGATIKGFSPGQQVLGRGAPARDGELGRERGILR